LTAHPDFALLISRKVGADEYISLYIIQVFEKEIGMEHKLHVEVRQVDVAKALEESATVGAYKILEYAILRAIGHYAEISVFRDGVTIKLPSKKTPVGYYYQGLDATRHAMRWDHLQAKNVPWVATQYHTKPQMPDFDFDLPLDEVAWKALGLGASC
jgi:hypothetical protein